MIEFALHIFITALAILGIWQTVQPGMIFHVPARWLDERLPEWALKPLFGCPYCMSSVWGCLAFFACYPGHLILLPVFILAVCGLTTVLFRD